MFSFFQSDINIFQPHSTLPLDWLHFLQSNSLSIKDVTTFSWVIDPSLPHIPWLSSIQCPPSLKRTSPFSKFPTLYWLLISHFWNGWHPHPLDASHPHVLKHPQSTKGQLISKGPFVFSILILPKNEQKIFKFVFWENWRH